MKTSNPLIVFVSPDGGGKTTTINEFVKILPKEYFIKKRHIRFNIIPRLGHLIQWIKSPLSYKKVFVKTESKTSDPVVRHIYGKNLPLWKILIVLLYEVFDYLLGYFLLFGNNKKEIYLFDRYIYDYYTERDWCNTPLIIMKFIMRIIPKPSLIVVLYNDPDVIYSRKPELDIKDIKYTQDRIDKLLVNHHNVLKISTDEIPATIAQKVIEAAEL
jgi:hypothetical protein